MHRATQEYRLDKARFRCRLPSAWEPRRDEARQEREKVYGVLLRGKESQGVAAIIGIDYYAPGNKFFKDAQDYMKRQFAPRTIALKGERTEPVEWIKVAGIEGKLLVTHTFTHYQQKSHETVELPVREERAVLPFEGGFFVLTFSTPEALHKDLKPDFDLVLKTFRTLRRRLP